jgi:mono/diheme cytochrome c family protein
MRMDTIVGMGIRIAPALAAVLVLGVAQAAAQGVVTDAGIRSSASSEVPTYYGEAREAFARNCAACHRENALPLGGVVAPFSVLSYEEAKRWASRIARQLKDGSMPPWGAAREHQGEFKGERYISDEDKQTLIAWVEGGAPLGDPAEEADEVVVPGRAEPEEGPDGTLWWAGIPDATASFVEPVLVCDAVQDWQLSLRMVMDQQIDEPQWVKSTEIAVGSGMMHHATSSYLGVAVPGRGPQVYPEGWAFLMPEDPAVSLSMHYVKEPGPGTAEEDFTRGGFTFLKTGEVVKHVVSNTIPMNFDFLIPAGHPNYETRNQEVIEEDLLLLALAPHSHYRGNRVKIELERPGQDERETLLWVPDYDFNWQFHNEFKEPKFIPAGSILHITWWYDNSTENAYNPDPTENVIYGPRSADEMMNSRYYFTPVEPLNLVVGQDPIPEDLLKQARESNERAKRSMEGWTAGNGSLSEPCPSEPSTVSTRH